MYFTSIYTWFLCVAFVICQGSAIESDDGFMPILEHALEALCPYNAVCRARSPRLVSNDSDYYGCCSDCSCDESCGLTENCCLPEMDIHRVVDRSHQQCLKPSTNQMIALDMAFNMVVDSYPDGNGTDCGDKLTTCGEDEFASSIGAFYPVFSNKTGRIYKNKQCAKCHGLNEEDLVHWKVYLQCDNIISEGTIYVDVSAALSSLENSKPAPNCHYVFYYPGPSSDIKHERCKADRMVRCLDTFYVDSRLNMTREEIRSTCIRGLNSSIYDMFTYTFCYICGKAYSNILDKPFLCRKEKENPEKGIPDSAFTSLVYPEILESKHSNGKWNEKEAIACLKQTSNKNQIVDNCRVILCPTGRLRRTHDGQCVFPTKTFNYDFLTLSVQLNPNTRLYESNLYTSGYDFISMFSTHSPWLPVWEVRSIVYKSSIDSYCRSVIDYFVVNMRYKNHKRNIVDVLSDIEKNLTLHWLVKFKSSDVTHEQTLSKFIRLYMNDDGTVGPVPSIQTERWLQSHTANLKHPRFTSLVFDRHGGGGFPITRMFFCDQVELKYHEYEMNLKMGLFHHTMLNRPFYQGEFAYVFDDSGQGVPRICLEDSRFTTDQGNTSTSSGNTIHINYLFYIISLCMFIDI